MGDEDTQEKLERLRAIKIVGDLDQNILSLCDVEAIQGEIEDSEKVLERVVACKKRIHDALQKLTNESNTPQGQPVAGVNSFPHMPLIEAKAKLPMLTLPKFSLEKM